MTSTGGAVNVFAGGDVNVNQSRIMTFQGGDITVWSDRGNIYAGQGDKATIMPITRNTCARSDPACAPWYSRPQ